MLTRLRYATSQLRRHIFETSPSSSILVLTIQRPDYAAQLRSCSLLHRLSSVYIVSHLPHLIKSTAALTTNKPCQLPIQILLERTT